MQFKVHVADRETGAEREIQLEAPTVQQARAQANKAGYLVSSIEPIAQLTGLSPKELTPEQRGIIEQAIGEGRYMDAVGSYVNATGTTMKSAEVYVDAAAKKMGVTFLSPKRRSRPRPGEPDAPTAVGGILGLVLGAVIGFNLGGPFGVVVGAICGIVAGMGIGSALAPCPERSKLGAGGRLALAGVTSGIAVALFFGFCILPLNWWNGFWSSGSKTSGGTNPSTYDAEGYSEADRALRAAGMNPSDVSSSDKAELQRSIQNLSDTLERNKQHAPSSLDRARDYARSEYESNKKIMSETEARRQYEKDLGNIAHEARDKGVGR